jgi:transcriptional regulator with XRE-family HTH domain
LVADPTLGPALQTLRTLRGLTLRELAEASGSTTSNLSRYERGKGCPKHTTIVRILKALELPYSALLRAQALVTDPSGVDDGGPDLDLPTRVSPAAARRAAVELARLGKRGAPPLRAAIHIESSADKVAAVHGASYDKPQL